jgi:hypothetical protein
MVAGGWPSPAQKDNMWGRSPERCEHRSGIDFQRRRAALQKPGRQTAATAAGSATAETGAATSYASGFASGAGHRVCGALP